MEIKLYWEVPPYDDAGVSDDADVTDADVPEPGTFDECERAGVVRYEYSLQDMSDCIKYSDGWMCSEVDFGVRIDCEKNRVLPYDRIAGGDYRLEIWGDSGNRDGSWYAICPDPDKEVSFYVNGAFYVGDVLYMDGSDKDKPYRCNVSYYPSTKND
jgi:hypothetical protein